MLLENNCSFQNINVLMLGKKKDELFPNNAFVNGCEKLLEALIKQKANTGLCSLIEKNIN